MISRLKSYVSWLWGGYTSAACDWMLAGADLTIAVLDACQGHLVAAGLMWLLAGFMIWCARRQERREEWISNTEWLRFFTKWLRNQPMTAVDGKIRLDLTFEKYDELYEEWKRGPHS